MNKRLLVLNVRLSGVNKHLFKALEKEGWSLEIVDIPVPKKYRCLSMLKTVNFNRPKWVWDYYEKLDSYIMTSSVFQQRTRFCEKVIKSFKHNFDLIFQIGGLFAPSFNHIDKPYVTYNDYTTRLAEKEYLPWFPFASKRAAQRWYELEGRLYRNAAKVFTFSNRTRESVTRDYNVERNKVITVGSGANLEEIPSEREKHYSKDLILFIGVDFKRKGGHVLLDAFKKVKEEIPSARLVIVGPDSLDVNLDGVELAGSVRDRECIKKFYKEASIFAMPSIADPFPNVLLEAMAHRLPCVGTDVSGIPEQIGDGETGFIVPVNDADKLSEKIIVLLKNKGLMREMGMNGYKRVLTYFNWDNVGERIDREMERVVR